MLRSVALCGIVIAVVGCRGTTGPAAGPERPADFHGVITFITDDGRFRIDDGSTTACGFSDVLVPEAAEVRWRIGGRARRDALVVGRRVSIWQPEAQRATLSARCHAVEAQLVVIENLGR